ncbi:MAG: hypothetical protein ABW123_10535 [Cystobacter sp.]
MPPTSSPGTVRHLLLTAVALSHLLLVLVNALHLQAYFPPGVPGRLLQLYGQWSGASTRFNFFAPVITPSVRVSFDLSQESGEVTHDALRFDDEAMNVRGYCMALRFEVKDNQENMARAWAALMFGWHPEARAVTVRVDALRLPTMEAYRAGERPEWTERYRLGFEHRRPASLPQAQAVTP